MPMIAAAALAARMASSLSVPAASATAAWIRRRLREARAVATSVPCNCWGLSVSSARMLDRLSFRSRA